MLVGIGEDTHRFTEGKKLVLGGIDIEGCAGLEANSDGDAVIHALCNAIASALGKGSISTYADRLCLEKGIMDSREYIKQPLGWARESSYVVGNVSISIEAKKPKIEPVRSRMQESLGNILGIEPDKVGITATSGEGLTSFGRGEGIRVSAIVTLFNDG